MKTLEIEVPDRLAKGMAILVQDGWFASEAELARLALIEFLKRHQFTLQEQFQREDVQWALDLKAARR